MSFMDSNGYVVKKPLGFFSIAAIGLSSILVTTILCVSGIAVYGIRTIDRKTTTLQEFVAEMVKVAPQIRAALPPVLADAISDVRTPEYREALRVTAKVAEDRDRRGYARAIVSVENTGTETVSLLSMRLVGLDEAGSPAREQELWAATPLQIENEWRGPLLPNETRRIVVYGFADKDITGVSPEITDLRVWRRADAETGEQGS